MRSLAEEFFTEIDLELEELIEAFPFQKGVDRLYDRFGYWETYHILDLVHNQDYNLNEVLARMKKEPLGSIIKEAYAPDVQVSDAERIFLQESTRFSSTNRNYADGNICIGRCFSERLEDDHYREHIFTKALEY